MLAVIAVFAAVFVVASAKAEQESKPVRSNSSSTPRPVEKPSTQRYRGVVKRFSSRNGWGLIKVDEVCGEAEAKSTPGEAGWRPDVRFYRKEQAALGLGVGDVVTFCTVIDEEAPPGWCRAANISRDLQEDGQAPEADSQPKPEESAPGDASDAPPSGAPPDSDGGAQGLGTGGDADASGGEAADTTSGEADGARGEDAG
eukprot:CAMPEP_0171201388 /NCGR_PEP_ID=MMETSP0790-20130122/24464_1 /TAXON_ID=2925 /ORGANISM="Alexandrium catenella, Strain OF101" /LENGTH=199 /DNA_ID=CAMNT_0011666785 /DNA_START=60 /DNA_END=655 /DNA_ORIENTATION=-